MTKKDFYDSIKNNLAELRKFFAEMSKGGDLHNHLIGSAYYLPMTGREHHGDENGQTTTFFTQYKVTFKLNKK